MAESALRMVRLTSWQSRLTEVVPQLAFASRPPGQSRRSHRLLWAEVAPRSDVGSPRGIMGQRSTDDGPLGPERMADQRQPSHREQ